MPPKLIVEFSAVRRETQYLPTRMIPVTSDYTRRIRGAHRGHEDCGISQKQVKFGKDQLTQRNIVAIQKSFEKGAGCPMKWRLRTISIQQDVRIKGDHGVVRKGSAS